MNIRARFQDLPFWTLHGVIAAAPSYILACLCITPSTAVETHLGMISGTVAIILMYSLTSSTERFSIRRADANFSRALRLAAHLRVAAALIAILSLSTLGVLKTGGPMVVKAISALLMIDFYPGVMATIVVDKFWQLFGYGNANPAEYFSSLAITLVTGMFFSIGYLVLALVLLFVRSVGGRLVKVVG